MKVSHVDPGTLERLPHAAVIPQGGRVGGVLRRASMQCRLSSLRSEIVEDRRWSDCYRHFIVAVFTCKSLKDGNTAKINKYKGVPGYQLFHVLTQVREFTVLVLI